MRVFLRLKALLLALLIPHVAQSDVPSPSQFAHCAGAMSILSVPISSGIQSKAEAYGIDMGFVSDKYYKDFFAYVSTEYVPNVLRKTLSQEEFTEYLSEVNEVGASLTQQMEVSVLELFEGNPQAFDRLIQSQKDILQSCDEALNSDSLDSKLLKEGKDSSSMFGDVVWQQQEMSSKFTDQTNAFLITTSDMAVKCGRFSKPEKLTLQIQCVENTTRLFVNGESCHFASGFGGYGDVDLRIDQEKMFSLHMDASTDSHAIGLWTGAKSIPLVKKMFEKDSLNVRVTPYGQSPIELTFPITGLKKEIKPLRDACNW
jgi:type VI secretion system protein VasI